MAVYRVPLSAKGEIKLVFGLTTAQVFALGLGLLGTAIIAGAMKWALDSMLLFCIPFGLPALIAGVIFAFFPKHTTGGNMSLGEYYVKKMRFGDRPRHYLRLRPIVEELDEKEGK